MRIQLVESENSINVLENIASVTKKISVNYHKADLFIYPECSLTGYGLFDKAGQIKDHNLDFNALEDLCKTKNVGVFLGGIDEDRHNGYYGFLPKKKSYFKTHLGKKEETFFKKGQALTIFSYKEWKIGVAICIESHIPDLIQHYRIMGCHLIIMPFASPGVCGNRMKLWEKYLPTRAYDNGIYIAAVNLKDDYFSGGAMVINPKGEILQTQAGKSVYDLDFELVKSIQSEDNKLNYIIRRRPELY